MTPWAQSYLAPDGSLAVVEAAARDDSWAHHVRAALPQARLHALPRGAAPLGRTLDDAVGALGLRHLNYLRIAEPAAALPVLLGARRLLSHARIDVIEIAGDPADPALAAVAALLASFELMVLPASAKLEDLLLAPPDQGVALLALHRRFAGAIGDARRDPDLGALMAAHAVKPRGIIHVGAHEGQEVPAYLALGFARVLLVEAEPALAAALARRFAGEPRVAVAACAITEADGTVDLRVASSTASSSILALKGHAALFPDIREVGRITVPARRLDSLLAERRDAPDAYNVLTLDIQGAELLALRGAAGLLAHLDALLVEVNFAELYQGCAQIEDIDDQLAGHGFARTMTMSPYQSGFGDAFYVRRQR